MLHLSIVYSFWVVHLDSLTTERTDSIVYPNQDSVGHVHSITGGNKFSSALTSEIAMTSTCTTADNTADMSNYWAPQLYYKSKNGSLALVPLSNVNVYYQARARAPGDTAPLTGPPKGTTGFPKGMQMLAGDPTRRTMDETKNEDKAIQYVCLGADGYPEIYKFPDRQCSGGLRAECRFPSCWNGVSDFTKEGIAANLRYPDGKDNGNCPTSHPRNFISIFGEFIYKVQDFEYYQDANKNGPWMWSNGDTTGYGFHCDFVDGWQPDVLLDAINRCQIPDGTGDQDKCPAFTERNVLEKKPCQLEKQSPKENIGLNGPVLQIPSGTGVLSANGLTGSAVPVPNPPPTTPKTPVIEKNTVTLTPPAGETQSTMPYPIEKVPATPPQPKCTKK